MKNNNDLNTSLGSKYYNDPCKNTINENLTMIELRSFTLKKENREQLMEKQDIPDNVLNLISQTTNEDQEIMRQIIEYSHISYLDPQNKTHKR